jgi:hypothetical protein
MAVYGIYLVGTYSPKKGKRQEDSFPFEKLTAADARVVERGWARRATRWFERAGKNVLVQCISWKDCKVVGFISTAVIGACADSSVMRSVKGGFKSLKVMAHDCILSYLEFYGAVDRADRGMADFTISYSCKRWYMRVVFWVIDAIIWNVWVLCRTRIDEGNSKWEKYSHGKSKVDKRYVRGAPPPTHARTHTHAACTHTHTHTAAAATTRRNGCRV